MNTLMQKIFSFFQRLWLSARTFLKPLADYWVSALAIFFMLIVGTYWLLQPSNKQEKNQSNPEIAQVFEPRIGEPLPPTTEPGYAETPAPTSEIGKQPAPEQMAQIGTEPGQVAGTFIAPSAGVDLTPISYSNTELGFKTILPAGSVSKNISNSSVEFRDGNGALLYLVQSYGATSENIDSILSQIKGSATVKSANKTTLEKLPAVQFTAKDIPGTGFAVISKGKLFYLIGDKDYFTSFKVL